MHPVGWLTQALDKRVLLIENHNFRVGRLGIRAAGVENENGLPAQRSCLHSQQVVDLGFELPNPYGVAIIPARIRQDLVLQDLAIGVDNPPDREIDFVDFGTPNAPVCIRTYSAVARPKYEGTNIALGITAAMGWDRLFVALPITYAWTDVDIINETLTALNITPRIGMTGDAGNRGTVAVFLGGTYLRA